MMTRTHNFKYDLKKIPYDDMYLTGDIVIGEGVWIGQNAIILPAVDIGKGAVIGAGGVVAKSIPDYAICVGNPAHIIGFRDEAEFMSLLDQEQYTNKYRHSKNYTLINTKPYMEQN